MAEMEKLGPKYRIALQIARDERWHRLACDHKGTYADGTYTLPFIDKLMPTQPRLSHWAGPQTSSLHCKSTI
jgi:hypothetical protein